MMPESVQGDLRYAFFPSAQKFSKSYSGFCYLACLNS
jgi:hypothetical protein